MSRLRIYSRTDEAGVVRSTWLLAGEGGLSLLLEGPPEEALPLPPGALGAVFGRYAKPLEEPPALTHPALHLPDPAGARLRGFRFMNFGDVYPTDYLLLERPGEEPVAAPAPLVAAALVALARSAAARLGR